MFPTPDAHPSRRRFLTWTSGGLAISAIGQARPGRSTGAIQPRDDARDADRVAKLAEQAKRAGLGPFGDSRTEHFLGVGDAPEPFREAALEICEGLGRAFLGHLRDRGFRVEFPEDRMTVVVLKDAISYGALVGEAPGKDVGGHFDLDADRLVVFDFRPDHGVGGAAERINTFTLVHETTHLLCFNTGLLSLKQEPPKCVTEGLATYFEMWRKTSRAPIGRVNQPRLDAIRASIRAGEAWIDASRLLTEDALFDDPKTAQLAYAQAWVLIYSLLSSRSMYRPMVAWLDELRETGGADRVATLEKHLGPIGKLDDRLRRLGRELVRG